MKNMYPKISVIIPSFNQGEFIEKTLLSVINQNYPNYEILVIDGGSKDKTIETIKKYESYVSCWVSEPDRGQADAVNKGLKIASGEIIGWLNSDDTYAENAFANVVSKFRDDAAAEAVYGNFIYTDIYDNVIRKRKVKNGIDRELLLNHNYLGQPAIFFKKSVVDKIGFLNEDLVYTLDWEYFLRMSQNCKFIFCNNYLATYRLHVKSKTSAFGNEKNRKEIQYLFEKYHDSNIKYNSAHKLKMLIKRFGIILNDGIYGYVKFYNMQYGFSLKSLFNFISWRWKF